MTNFLKVSGYTNIAAGLLLLAFWYLYAILLPYAQLTNSLSILVQDKDWVFVNILGVTGTLLGMVGLVGLYLRIGDASGGLGLAGFVLVFIGTALLLGTLLWDTIVWPILVQHDPSLLDFSGPIYTSKIFVPYFVTAGLVYALGYVLFGIAIARSGMLSSWGGVLLAVGAPLFGMGALFGKMQVYPRSIGITAMGAALIWLGLQMVKS